LRINPKRKRPRRDVFASGPFPRHSILLYGGVTPRPSLVAQEFLPATMVAAAVFPATIAIVTRNPPSLLLRRRRVGGGHQLLVSPFSLHCDEEGSRVYTHFYYKSKHTFVKNYK